jgi:beta-lactamase regulating signal transducer with metallopeptidase domain
MFLLKASLVLALAQAVVAALPRLPAALKHLVLVAGMTSFLVIPLLEAAGPAVPVLNVGRASARPSRRAEARPASARASSNVGGVAAMIWLGGMLAIISRLLVCRWRLRRIVREAVPPSPRLLRLFGLHRCRLLRSARIHVPMVWGLRSGTLLLPEAAETWTDEELRATFIHELGHLRRLDSFTLGLLNGITVWLWFHPQVWFARRRALAEGERACDDLVLRAGSSASGYAQLLLDVARRKPEAAMLAMSHPAHLEERMRSILSPSTNRQSIGGKRLMITIAAFIAVVMPLSAVQLAAPAPAAPAPIISAGELAGHPYHVVEKLEGRVCTLKLKRPTPAEAVAARRLQQKAGEYRVDGVANVRCYREIGIGFSCPTAVVCAGDAIVFDDKN